MGYFAQKYGNQSVAPNQSMIPRNQTMLPKPPVAAKKKPSILDILARIGSKVPTPEQVLAGTAKAGKQLVKSGVQAGARLSVTGYNAGQATGKLAGAGLAKIAGNQRAMQRLIQEAGKEVNKNRKIGILGNVKPSLLKNAKNISELPGAFRDPAGVAAEIASIFSPVGKSTKALTAAGALFGLGSEAQQDKPTVGGTVQQVGLSIAGNLLLGKLLNRGAKEPQSILKGAQQATKDLPVGLSLKDISKSPDLTWAKGTRAAGIQNAGLKNYNEATKVLENAGELPKAIKTESVTKDFIKDYYTNKKPPIVGDTFTNAKGEVIEITKVQDGSVDYFLKGKKKGIAGTVYADTTFKSKSPLLQEARGMGGKPPSVPPKVEGELPISQKTEPFNSQKYVKEMVEKQGEAGGGIIKGILQKGKDFLTDVRTKFGESLTPALDIIEHAKKTGKFEILPSQDFYEQTGRVLRSSTIGGQFAKANGLDDVIRNVPDLNALNQYMIAKQATRVTQKGIQTGRDVAKDTALIKELGPAYEPFAQKVTQYSQKLLDYIADSGLVSKDLATKLKAEYPDYVPLNRIFTELEKSGQITGSRAIASLSKQTVVQGLKGSEREIEDPLTSILTKTNDAFKQGEKNKAAKMLAQYRNLPDNPLQITPLRTAEDVTERIKLFGEAKELKPLQSKVKNFIQKENKWIRQLQSEINQFEKKGLSLKLKEKAPASNTLISGFRQSGNWDPATPKIVGDVFAQTKKIGDKSTKSFIERLITNPSNEILALRKKIVNREPKLSYLLDDVQKLRDDYFSIADYRKSLIEEGRLLKDSESRGKATFSVLKDGIKEIYETTPEIATAVKQLDVQRMNILGKIFAFPVRVARLGITGINAPFIAANIARDQVGAFINSSKGLRGSAANVPVFLHAFWEALGHGKLYQEAVSNGALGTSFDIAREQIPKTIAQIRASRSLPTKVLYTVTHPAQLLRAVEDVVARSEELTRLQQYAGTKQALLKEGRTLQDATILATKQAREATVDFMRRGEWGTVLNSAFLYLNAGIQGSRTIIRSFKARPVATSAKVVASVFFPVATLTAWNLADPDRKKAYDDIQDYEKDNNLIIIPPNPTQDKNGKWNVIKIPLPFNYSALVKPIRQTMEGMANNEYPTFQKAVQALWQTPIETLSPFNTVDFKNPSKTFSQLIPQAIKPSVESITNKNLFTGLPIVSQSLEKNSPAFQVKDYTSGTARKVGGALNVSPIKVEQFIRSTAGGVGEQILHYTDQALAGLKLIPESQIGGRGTFESIMGRFQGAVGGKMDDKTEKSLQELLEKQSDDRFLLRQQAEGVYEELKNLNELGKKEEANQKAKKIKQKNPQLFEKIKDVKQDDELGLDYSDRLIKQLGVENGERAKYIWETVKMFDTPELKNAYIKDLRTKKIISDKVWEQLKQLRVKNP